MPSTLADYIGGTPQNLPMEAAKEHEPVRVFTPAVYYAENGSVTANVRPYRNGNLPSPSIDGWSENVDPTNGFTIDQNFSPRMRASFLGQGHYDLVPVPYVPIDGPGTPNVRYKGLRQGALSQVMGLQRPDTVNALQFASALSGYQAGMLADR